MTPEELKALLNQAADQIKSVTNAVTGWDELLAGAEAMRANEDAQIYKHLNNAFVKLLDPNLFPTLIDPQGHRKKITIGNHTLQIVVTHREPTLEKLKGVDVFYDLMGIKALAFQHKKRSRDGTFTFGNNESDQRDKIQQLCGACKITKHARQNSALIRPYCASVNVIGDWDGKAKHVVSACRIEDYRQRFFNASNTAPDAIPRPAEIDSIDQMFLQCLVGRSLRERAEEISFQSIQDAFLTQPDLLIKAKLSKTQPNSPGTAS